MNIAEMNTGVIAYIGDAYYALQVKEYLVSLKINKTKKLQITSEKYLSARAQSEFILGFIEKGILNSEEEALFKRGRNFKSDSVAKNADIISYRNATGFETIWGYLYINKMFSRLEELFSIIIDMVQ